MKPLSPVDSLFLWFETRAQPMHVAGLHIYSPPKNARPDFVATMVARWRTHLQAQAPFNQRPVLKLGRWHWEADPEFELDYHLRHLALPQPGRIRELLALVSQMHGHLLDRNRPLWEATIIEGLPGGRFAMYVKIHHALVDGVTGARLLAAALSPTARGTKPPFWAQVLLHPRRAKPSPGRTAAELVKGLADTLASTAQAGRQILPGIGSGLADLLRLPGLGVDERVARAFAAPPTPFNVLVSGSRRFAAQSWPLRRFQAIGKAQGATVNDVVLAVCAGALRRHLLARGALPSAPLVAMVPVSMHGEAGAEAGGNQVALLLASLATDVADPLARLQAIVQGTRAAKAQLKGKGRLEKLAHASAMLSPLAPSLLAGDTQRRPPFNVVISNVPGPQNRLYMDRAGLDESYPVSIPTHYLALNITITGYRDALGFGFTACRRSVPQLQRMLDHTAEALAELES